MKRCTNAEKKIIINGFCKENSQVQRFVDGFISYLFKVQNVNKELESGVRGRERERGQKENKIKIA